MTIVWLGVQSPDETAFHRLQHPYYLKSFIEIRTRGVPNELKGNELFLDSGAYSAWSRGAALDIDEFCACLRAHADHIHTYASLDVIPGRVGVPASPDEIQKAADRSWEAFTYMRAEGLNPMPVYHFGEAPSVLHRILNAGCGIVGLGGLVGVPTPARVRWLGQVFGKQLRGAEQIKVHGFGMTNVNLIARYPWYSVDSTTWTRMAFNGVVLLPSRDGAGRFLFTQAPKLVSTADKTASDSTIHLSRLSRPLLEALHEWLSECGMTLADVSTGSEGRLGRRVCNGLFFKRVQSALSSFQRPSLSRLPQSLW